MKLFVFGLLGWLLFGAGISFQKSASEKKVADGWENLILALSVSVAMWWVAHQ